MIIILSQDPDTILSISRNQANVPDEIFGVAKPLSMTMPTLGKSDNLFIVADRAKRLSSWAPALGDSATGSYWDAALAMTVLDDVFPQNFSGNVYVAACQTEHPLSCMQFAGTFKTVLLAARSNAGKVYGLSGPALTPIPGPNDRRWFDAKATPAIATPLTPQSSQDQTQNPLIPVLT